MKTMMFCMTGFALALLLPTAPPLNAQDYRAKVRGIVTDASQAVVPGATVTLTNVNTTARHSPH